MTKKKLKTPPFTLEETWQYELAMWKWISMKCEGNENENVAELKVAWLKENNFDYTQIEYECFFCQYDKEHGGQCSVIDRKIKEEHYCPGILVNSRFHCANITYDYNAHPVKFYRKLVELNKKRRKKK